MTKGYCELNIRWNYSYFIGHSKNKSLWEIKPSAGCHRKTSWEAT